MVDVIATNLLISYVRSQDKLDSVTREYGTSSREFSEALEEHSKLHSELRELISLGLAERGDYFWDV